MMRGPTDHVGMGILHTSVSGIPLVLGLRTRMYNPYVSVLIEVQLPWQPCAEEMDCITFFQTVGHLCCEPSGATIHCLGLCQMFLPKEPGHPNRAEESPVVMAPRIAVDGRYWSGWA